jgi:hypothetical protein
VIPLLYRPRDHWNGIRSQWRDCHGLWRPGRGWHGRYLARCRRCGCGVGAVEHGLGTAGHILGASSSSLGETGASPLLRPPHARRSIISTPTAAPPPVSRRASCALAWQPTAPLPPAEVCCCLSSLASILAAMGNKVLEIVSHGRRYSCR